DDAANQPDAAVDEDAHDEAADQGSDKADDQVTHDAVAAALHHQAGQPAGDQAHEYPGDDAARTQLHVCSYLQEASVQPRGVSVEKAQHQCQSSLYLSEGHLSFAAKHVGALIIASAVARKAASRTVALSATLGGPRAPSPERCPALTPRVSASSPITSPTRPPPTWRRPIQAPPCSCSTAAASEPPVWPATRSAAGSACSPCRSSPTPSDCSTKRSRSTSASSAPPTSTR